jgi:hypothetical protein
MAGNLIIATETFLSVAEQAIIDWVEELNLENVNNDEIPFFLDLQYPKKNPRVLFLKK